MRVAMVIGAASPPGRLSNAIDTLVARAKVERPDCTAEVLNLAVTPVAFCDGRTTAYDSGTEDAIKVAANADAVLLATPVYRGSYTGVLKNYLDLLPVTALRDKPVGLVAMGGTQHHYLGVDSQLRPVLAWFGALTLPNSIYLIGKDFTEGKLSSEAAAGELFELFDAMTALAKARAGRSYGPAPLAARWG